MKSWWKIGTLAAALAVIGLLAFGTAAFAQGPTPSDTPQPGYGYGMGFGMGRMGGIGGPQNSLVAVAGKVLNMSQTDLVAALNNGKTIADVAKEKGISTDKIVGEFLANRSTSLKTLVDAKRITQAQADSWLATMKTNVTAQLTAKFTPRGYGMGAGFVDANHEGICDLCGAQAGQGGPGFGMRGRWATPK